MLKISQNAPFNEVTPLLSIPDDLYLRTLISCQAGCFFNFQLSTCIVFSTAFPAEFFCSEWLLSLSLLGVLAVLQGPP